jgi:PAS domain S-box-containing protein
MLSVRKPLQFLPVGKSLSLIVAIFVCIVASLLLLNNVRSEILSGVRAYVSGEGFYSKAQKDAVNHLVRYAQSHAERDYDKYLDALAVPLGDRTARIELEKPHPDLARAYQGFIDAHNHPDDVENLATLFRRFRHISYMSTAIDVWTHGDALIAQLHDLGDDLHASIASGQADAAHINHILEAVGSLNEQLTVLEDEFSRTLGEGNRWLERRLLQLTYAATALLLVTGIFLSWMILRQVTVADRALRAQAERWRVTLASIGDGVLVTDARMTIVSLNAAAEALTGWKEADAIGRQLDDIFRITGEPANASLENPARRALREGQIAGLGTHAVLLAKDGTERPIDDSAAPMKDHEGRIIGAVLVFRDVSERRRAEEALRHTEERYRSLVAVTTSAIWTTDASGAFVSSQPAWEAYMGQGSNGHARQGWLNALHPDDRQRVHALWARALAQRTIFEAEGRILQAGSGHYRYFVAHAVPLLNADGSTREWIGTLTDVDDRKRAEELAGARARQHAAIARLGETALSGRDLQSLMDEAADHVTRTLGTDMCGVLELSPDGRELLLRAGVGWTPGRVGRSTIAVELRSLAGFTLASSAPVMTNDLRSETRFTGSALLNDHGVISGLSVVIAGDGGHQYGVLGTYAAHPRAFTRDDVNFFCAVANVLAVAIQRKRAEEALQDANRQKDDFLAMLAHELRNPLSPIRSAVHVLRRLGPKEPRIERAHGMIDRQVAHMTRLVDDLLDVSRIARGKISLHRDEVDLAQLVRLAGEDHRAMLETAGLTLTLTVPDQPIWVRGDPTRLAQTVGNVLHNASKFTNPGGHVSMELAADGSAAVLGVLDTGIGMEPKVLARIFEPFSQADHSLERTRGGLGLGLALVKGWVELHGGTVRAASEGLGKGSAFTIRLPLESEPRPLRTTPTSAAGGRRPCRVLVIEDNLDVAESMKVLLEIEGHHVAVAHTGPAGIETARQFHPEVVLCDIGLPGGLDGFGVAKLMRKDTALCSAYLIALTGYGQQEDRRRASDAGFDMHLIKPVDPAVLDRVLAKLPNRAGA